ncbi:MAG TPA: copper resistance protein CopC [Gaiellaceae bacterium]|jgi:copper transport protein|nr:copper resistance protein CopC [Gaiellaceae bacterium]
MRRAVALAAAAALLLPAAASAHAFLLRSVPAAQSTVREAPDHVLLVFDEGVSPAHIDVTDAAGKSVRAGRPFQRSGRPAEIVVPLRHPLPKGGYVVRWSEVDRDDGHLISGAFSFGVGTPAPHVHASSGSSLRFGDSASRWLMLLGLLVAGGLVAFRRIVLRRPEPRFVAAAAAASAVTACGAAILLARQPTFLETRFDRTTFAGVFVALAAALLGLAALRVRGLVAVADVATVALLALPTLDGHAVAPGRPHALTVPSDLVHVLGASVWIGGVFALVALVPHVERSSAVRRFAPVALGAVAAIAVTGVLRAVVELHAVSQLWSTSYGRAILVKTALFLCVLGLAAVSRGRPGVRGIGVEAVLLFGLVAAVAVLVGLRPGRDVPPKAAAAGPPPFVTAAAVGPYAVGVSLAPEGGAVGATATVLGVEGPADGLDLRFGVAGRTAPARACGPGCYRATLPVARPTRLTVSIGKTTSSFRTPELWPAPSAGPAVARATATFRRLRTLTVVSRLSSAPGNETTTVYRMQAPNRLSGVERESGAAEIIIGARRWDRDSATAAWEESPAVVVRQPSVPWSPIVRNPHVVGDQVVGGRPATLVSFMDPQTPAWYTIAVDNATGRARFMDMIATAHFMHEEYRGFDVPLTIRPPR